MQKVETYYQIWDAEKQIKKHIQDGWRVHTCAMGTFVAGCKIRDHILVIYEKEG